MAEQLRDFLAETTLNGAINSAVTSLVVASASNFPTTGEFDIRIDDEILTVTFVSGTTFTVTRAAGTPATTAASHSNGATIRLVLTYRSLHALVQQYVNDAAGSLGGMIPVPPGSYIAITGTIAQFWEASPAGEGLGTYTNSAANNDKFGTSIFLPAGTYTLNVRVVKNSNRGILEAILDGVSLGTADLYNGTGTFATVTFSCGTLAEGNHTLEFKATNKNASSSGYLIIVEGVAFEKTDGVSPSWNLIRASRFIDATGWTGSGSLTVTYDQVPPTALQNYEFGRVRGVKLVPSSAGDRYLATSTSYHPVLEAGKTISISGWVKTTGCTDVANLRAIFRTSGGADVADINVASLAANQDWTFISGSYTVPATTGKMELRLDVDGTGDYYFAGVRVEYGGVGNNYEPNPADTNSMWA